MGVKDSLSEGYLVLTSNSEVMKIIIVSDGLGEERKLTSGHYNRELYSFRRPHYRLSTFLWFCQPSNYVLFSYAQYLPRCEFAFRRLHNQERNINAKFAGASHAADGQIPKDRVIVVAEQAHFAAAEADRAVVLDVEEISAAQMCVPVRLSCPQPAGVDLDLHRGPLRIFGIEVELTVDVFEVPADVRDHHVAHTEFGGSVPSFEEPTRQGGPLSFGLFWN